jgi:hypothetical protein
MVIADEFAWAHLPKAAGTATQAMFAAVPDLVLFQAPIDSNDKHDAFWAHAEAIEGKLRAMNIRRLPSWVLSTAHHKAVSGVWPEFEPLPMPTVEEMVESTEPDDVLRWMTDGPRMAVDRWLRAEQLADDVEALLLEIGTPSRVANKAVGSVPWVGKPYDHNVASTFSADEIRQMYERNPGWSEAERVAYGEIHEFSRL